MEEKIIIDEVNVAGCEFYQIEANELYPKAQYCGSMRNTFCEDEPNCYYKQLKRLEQENEELNEQIKALLEYRRKSVTCQECYNEGIATSEIKINKYKHALEEIRQKIDDCLYCDCGECKYNAFDDCRTRLLKDFKRIITKAIGE